MSSQSYEFSAKTVDLAIEQGLRELGLSRDQVEIQVITEGSRGLFGLGSTDARVRITPKPEPVPETEPQPEAAAQETAPESAAQVREPAEEAAPEMVPEAAGATEAGATEAMTETGAEIEHEEAAEEAPAPGAAGSATPEEFGPEQVKELATELLAEMLQLMGIRAQVVAEWAEPTEEQSEPPLLLDIRGENLGVLIGRHGETLGSIQYLVRLMINQRTHRWHNIVVDVDQYKARRAERLAQMARRMAEQVVRTGRPVSLEPMPPADRRLIHLALRDHEQVYTESTGEGERRKVQILPK